MKRKLIKIAAGLLLSCSLLISGFPGMGMDKASAAEAPKAMMTRTQGMSYLRQNQKNNINDVIEFSNTYVCQNREATVNPPVLVPSKGYQITSFRTYDRTQRASFVTMKAADGSTEQIKVNDIAFICAANGPKGRTTEFKAGYDLTPVEAASGNNWKLVVKNPYNEKTNPTGIRLPEISNIHSDYNCVIFDYEGLYSTGNSYLSAVVMTRGEGQIVAYDRIVSATERGIGTAIIHWPEEYNRNNYVLKVFAETYNGDHMTDYISDMRLIYCGAKVPDED